MNRIEMTIDLHKNGGMSCSQAILAAFGEKYGIDQEKARLLGRTLAGGVAGQGGMCGYLIGALLILAHAYNDKNESQAIEKLYPAVIKLQQEFKKKKKFLNCNDLLGIDKTTPEGLKKFKEEDLPSKYCYCEGGFGQCAAEILETLI